MFNRKNVSAQPAEVVKRPTGMDLVVDMAGQAMDASAPHAEEFWRLLLSATSPDRMPIKSDDVASLQLPDWRDTPNRVINASLEKALATGDPELVREVVWFGVDMLARWDDYLKAIGSHPDR